MEFKLRPWLLNDLDSLVEQANNPKIAQFMTNKFPHPYTVEAGRTFIEFANLDQPIHIFAIDVNGKAIGGIGIHPQDDIHCKNAELGYWIGEAYWNNGIMTNAIPLAIDFAFFHFDITRLFAKTFENNKASQHLLEKCGFKLEARLENVVFKNDVFLDELIYAYRPS